MVELGSIRIEKNCTHSHNRWITHSQSLDLKLACFPSIEDQYRLLDST